MGVFIYLLIIVGSPWLANAVIEFGEFRDLELEELDALDREMKEEDGLHVNSVDENTFRKLCKTFQTKQQFAVLVVGRPSATYKLDPKPKSPIYNKEGLRIGNNYAAAMFNKSGGKHTEVSILGYADEMVNKYKGKYHAKPQLFLYSKNSPCCGSPLTPNCDNGCAWKIKKKMMELRGKVTFMTIAWDYNYKMGAMPFDKAFLFSLNSMLSPENTRISWNTAGYCRKTPRKWFQKAMLECLLETAKAHPSCKQAKVRQDLARLINKVTWICGTGNSTIEDDFYPDPFAYDDDDNDGDEETILNEAVRKLRTRRPRPARRPARAPECWQKEVKSLDGDSCVQLSNKAYACAKQYNTNDLGPALNSSNPATYSNSAKDVRGDYRKLCFASGSSTKNSPAEQYFNEKNDETDETGFNYD